MRDLIIRLHEIINLIKDFTAGYGSETLSDGKMLIEYKGKRYAVKIEEIQNPSENVFKDIQRLKYII